MTHIRSVQKVNARLEPFAVSAGVFLLTALYYTRLWPLQLLSFALMLAVVAYWSFGIQRERKFTWSDLKLSREGWLANTLIAAALAIGGWYFFSFYNQLTRGTPLKLGYGGSIMVILAILSVATAEELFFRGYLQNKLNPHFSLWQRVLIAVIAMALFKNVIHMWEGLPLILHIELLLIGILHNVLPSLWMEWSGNLLGPLLLHVFWDLLVYAPMQTIPYWVY